MIDGIHRNTAHRRPASTPAHCPGLAKRAQGVLRITDLPDGRPTPHRYLPQLTGSKPQRGKTAFACRQLCARTGATRDLSPLPRLEFDAVYYAAYWYIAQQQAIARPNRRPPARHQLVSHRDATRSDHIAPLTIGVKQQSDMSATVRIVLDPLDLCRNTVLGAFEIDDPITLLVTAASMPNGDAALVVAATGTSLLG